jgi:hypothetical protein
VILRFTYLVATEIVTKFIWNSMIFILCLTLMPVWYNMDLPNEMVSSYHIISFYQMKWNNGCQTSP